MLKQIKACLLAMGDIAWEIIPDYLVSHIKSQIRVRMPRPVGPRFVTLRLKQKIEEQISAQRGDKFNVIKTNDKPRIGRLYIQRHEADSHLHYDISIVFDGERSDLFRGAVTKNSLVELFPDSSKSTAFIRQPQHSRGVFGYNWTGTIAEGYGKGYQELVFEEPVEILRTSRDKIVFNVYQSATNKEVVGKFALIKQNSHWLCVRRKEEETEFKFKNEFKAIANNEESRDLPEAAKQLSQKLSQNSDSKHSFVVEAKADGGCNLIRLGDKENEIWSYREGKRSRDIFLQDKFPEIRDDIHPRWKGTVCRGELLWVRSGKLGSGHVFTAIGREHPNFIAKFCNIADALRSRAERAKSNGQVAFMVYDVKRIKGRDCSSWTYGEKIKVMDKIAKEYNRIYVPMRFNSIEEAWNKVVRDLGGEGIIVKWLNERTPDEDSPEAPKWIKIKKVDYHDLRIVGWEPLIRISGEVDNSRIGVLLGESDKGIKSEVGSGFTDYQRRWFAENIEEILRDPSYIRVKAHHITDNGSLHGPVFKGPHEGKSEGKILELGLYDSADSLETNPYQLKVSQGWRS